MNNQYTKLCACALGCALGLVWSIGILLLGLVAWQFQYGHEMVHILGSVYLGFDATGLGSIYGAIWGLIDGFICGFLIAWIYNKMLCCKEACCKK